VLSEPPHSERGGAGDAGLTLGGNFDLTADVDFTSAALDAREAGLRPLAYLELGSFLVEGVRLMESRAVSLPGLKFLVHPDGLGSAFHVLVLGKDVPFTEQDFPHNRIRRLGL
jgi:SAM-dependent MidA family methyltransferase